MKSSSCACGPGVKDSGCHRYPILVCTRRPDRLGRVRGWIFSFDYFPRIASQKQNYWVKGHQRFLPLWDSQRQFSGPATMFFFSLPQSLPYSPFLSTLPPLSTPMGVLPIQDQPYPLPPLSLSLKTDSWVHCILKHCSKDIMRE